MHSLLRLHVRNRDIRALAIYIYILIPWGNPGEVSFRVCQCKATRNENEWGCGELEPHLAMAGKQCAISQPLHLLLKHDPGFHTLNSTGDVANLRRHASLKTQHLTSDGVDCPKSRPGFRFITKLATKPKE